jgi:hypothetical protein
MHFYLYFTVSPTCQPSTRGLHGEFSFHYFIGCVRGNVWTSYQNRKDMVRYDQEDYHDELVEQAAARVCHG